MARPSGDLSKRLSRFVLLLARRPGDAMRVATDHFCLVVLWLRLLLWRGRLTGAVGCVVSLTSYGARVRTVPYAIESIGRGSSRPQRLLLWLDDAEVVARPGWALRRLQRRGLEILLCPDYGPHKKQYPYASSSPAHSVPLITADDDVFYPRWWLSRLLRAREGDPDSVHCGRARVVKLDANGLAPYETWPLCDSDEPSFATLPTGVSGVVYPPALLDALRERGLGFIDAAPMADDLWIHATAVRAGIRLAQVASASKELRSIPGSGESGLWHSNMTAGKNNNQITRCYSGDIIALIRADADVDADDGVRRRDTIRPIRAPDDESASASRHL